MVTVIIPTYKRANYIERAINSILNQTYKDYEIIVVDDNNPNTDDRKALEVKMEKYKLNKNVIYLQHEKNKNGAAARNTGINIAKGEYITFLDDDDYFLPTRLEKMVQALDNNIAYDAAYSSSLIVKNSKIVSINYANRNGNFQKDLLMQKSFFGTGSNLFFRANALKDLNGFDERFIRHQDIELMIRYFNKYNILCVNDILVVKNNNDRKNVPNIENHLKVKELFLNTFKNEINNLTNEEKNKVYYLNYKSILNVCINTKQYSRAKEIIEIVKKYGKITFIEKMKILWNLINAYIKIDAIKTHFTNKRNLRKLNPIILEEIMYYERLECKN